MSEMGKLKDFFTKFSYRFMYFAIIWYRITMFFSKMKNVEVKSYKKMEEIPEAFEYGKKYRYDTLFDRPSDHLTHPTQLQHRLNEGKEFGDCDDHAIFWCVALVKSKLAKKVWFSFYAMKNIETGKRQGHAVCVFVGLDDQIYWTDYRMPRPIEKVKDFMHKSAASYRSIPLVGAIVVVHDVREDDTPVFGSMTRLLP